MVDTPRTLEPGDLVIVYREAFTPTVCEGIAQLIERRHRRDDTPLELWDVRFLKNGERCFRLVNRKDSLSEQVGEIQLAILEREARFRQIMGGANHG